MSELPKAGEEWFNRATLAVVSVMGVERIGGVPHKVWLVPEGERRLDGGAEGGHCYWRDPENFLRDYARNVPVTVGLLERMGWHHKTTNTRGLDIRKGLHLHWNGLRSVLQFCFSVYNSGDSMEFPVPSGGWTLRDLLNVLRNTFGINQAIPEPAEQAGEAGV